jgi:hypothetical protein
MRVFLCFLVLTVCFIFSNCNSTTRRIQIQNANIDLIIEAGENWGGPRNFGPQFALWVEKDNGEYIATLYVTSKSTRRNWRPEALPVWMHKMQNDDPINIDAVSSASPKVDQFPVPAYIDWDLLVEGQEYNVFLEINNSFDFNDFWTRNKTGVNGQPSLIYRGRFIGGEKDKIILTPIGHGSLDGSNGNITNGFEGFTTALTIINNVYIMKR